MRSSFPLCLPCCFSSSRLRKHTKKMLRGFFKTRYRAGFWFVVIFFIFGCLQENVKLIQNTGLSLPQPCFLEVRSLSPRVGHYTRTWHDRLGGYVIKQVIGKAGDRLWYDDGTLWLNKRKIGKPYTKDRDGRPLTPISSGVIPVGYVFLYAPPSRSFDSRYQEFGLVPQSALRGRLIPLSRGGEKRS